MDHSIVQHGAVQCNKILQLLRNYQQSLATIEQAQTTKYAFKWHLLHVLTNSEMLWEIATSRHTILLCRQLQHITTGIIETGTSWKFDLSYSTLVSDTITTCHLFLTSFASLTSVKVWEFASKRFAGAELLVGTPGRFIDVASPESSAYRLVSKLAR